MSSSWNEIIVKNYIGQKRTGNRGVFFGGYVSQTYNNIEYINITSTGNSIDFGDLTQNKYSTASASNGIIGLVCGGSTTNGTANTNAIERITFSIKSNSVDVGDLQELIAECAGCSNNSRMLIGGGSPSTNSFIKYIDFSSSSSSLFFGQLINNATRNELGSCSNDMMGLFCNGGNLNIIDYVIIQTLSNSVDFGDSLSTSSYVCGVSNDTRGVFHMGIGGNNKLQYITFSTLGNAIEFGTLSNSGYALTGCSNQVRGIFGGGTSSSLIEYITISILKTVSNFGNLTQAFICPSACSGD